MSEGETEGKRERLDLYYEFVNICKPDARGSFIGIDGSDPGGRVAACYRLRRDYERCCWYQRAISCWNRSNQRRSF